MLHRMDRFPTPFALLILLGTAERFPVCLNPAFFPGARVAMPPEAAMRSPSRAGLWLLLAPENCAEPRLPHKELLNGAESELSVLKGSSDVAW